MIHIFLAIFRAFLRRREYLFFDSFNHRRGDVLIYFSRSTNKQLERETTCTCPTLNRCASRLVLLPRSYSPVL